MNVILVTVSLKSTMKQKLRRYRAHKMICINFRFPMCMNFINDHHLTRPKTCFSRQMIFLNLVFGTYFLYILIDNHFKIYILNNFIIIRYNKILIILHIRCINKILIIFKIKSKIGLGILIMGKLG